MFREIKKFFVPVMSLLLAFVMVFTAACSNNLNDATNNPDSEIVVPSDGDKDQGDSPSSDFKGDDIDGDFSTTSWVDYDDPNTDGGENSIYELLLSDLEQEYDVFSAYVVPASDKEVYGIAYTDYSAGYVDEAGKTYFSSGFISLDENFTYSVESSTDGLEIHSVADSSDALYSYVYNYSTEDVHKHCILDNQYFEYDIIDGVLQYSQKDYSYGMDIDESRGNLYNYTTQRYEFIIEPIDYIPTIGTSLLGETDYQNIVDEIGRIIKSQNSNFLYADIETYAAYAMEALNSYILGLQEETFMGISTKELKDFASSLDPLQHLQIQMDESGNISIEIIKVQKLATLWEKIITSVVCAYAVVSGVVLNVLGNTLAAAGIVPAKFLFGAVGGGLIGAAMEAFSQVVVSGNAVSEIAWSKIAVACVSGALSGAITAGLSGAGFANHVLGREILDTALDGVIGGGEYFVNTLIDGGSVKDALNSFGVGLGLGIVVSGGFKALGYVAQKGSSWIKKIANGAPSTINEKSITKLGEDITDDGLSEIQAKAISKKSQDFANRSANKAYVDNTYTRDVFDLDGTYNPVASDKIKRFLKTSEDALYFKESLEKIDIVDHIQKRHLLDSAARQIPVDTAFKAGTYNSAKNTLLDALDNGKIYLSKVQLNIRDFAYKYTTQLVDHYEFIIDGLGEIGFNKITKSSCHAIKFVVNFFAGTNKLSRVVTFFPV